MRNDDFVIPSLLRDLRGWSLPELDDPTGQLVTKIGVGGAKHPEAAVGDLCNSVLDALEPVLILLSLCGYTPSRLGIADSASQVGLSLPFGDPMIVSEWLPSDWPPEVAANFLCVAVEVSQTSSFAVPYPPVGSGWLVLPLLNGSISLDLVAVLLHLESEVLSVQGDLLAAIEAAAGSAALADLAANAAGATGFLAMFEPSIWFVARVDDEVGDALSGSDADADAVAFVNLCTEAATQIDLDGGVATFLTAEVERRREFDTSLRDRFKQDRSGRQLLRQGLRGARRRHRELEPDGIHRTFRLGRSRRLTYTEFLIACHVEGIVDILHRLNQPDFSPRFGFEGDNVFGEAGQQYLIARLPFPSQALDAVQVKLVNAAFDSGRLSLSSRRWGAEHPIPLAVDPAYLSLSTGQLPVAMEFVDGGQVTPSLAVRTHPTGDEILQVVGVQHGDVLIFADQESGAVAEIAVVKNFTRNDLERLHSSGFDIVMAPPFDGLALSAGLRDTIAFALADGPGTAQDIQRISRRDSVAPPFPTGTPAKADPGTLDAPSARGIGLFPDDASHFHLCASPLVAALEVDAEAQRALATAAAAGIQLDGSPPRHQSEAVRAASVQFRQTNDNSLADFVTRFTQQSANVATIWHTFEIGEAKRPAYVVAGNTLELWPGDPVRNIRTNHNGPPTLFVVSTLIEAESGYAEQGLSHSLEVGLFVDRRGQVVLYVENAPSAVSIGESLQVADAVASLADGGLIPVGVFVPPEPDPPEPDPPDPDPPDPDPPDPDPPDPDRPTGLGTVLFRVIDDNGTRLPRAIVKVTGVTEQSIRTGDDGTALLLDQDEGVYIAEVDGYPSHYRAESDYLVVTDSSAEVELILSRIPNKPGLPPLVGSIAESSGFFIREAPGGTAQVLGQLFYQPLRVTVLEGREVPGEGPPIADMWYRVRFAAADFNAGVARYETVLKADLGTADGAAKFATHQAALGAHQGTEAWVGQSALSGIAMPWDHFLDLLGAFEALHAGESLLDRLSRIRKMGEESDVPGDDAVGVDGVDAENLSERTPDPNAWQIVYESKQVALPDAEIVDIHHFLLGVESLVADGRRSNNRTVYSGWDLIGLYPLAIGESFSAATWSGDVGAAVADLVRHQSDAWEAFTTRSLSQRRQFYFRTRAPDSDLLADVDAWGAYDLIAHPTHQPLQPAVSLVDLVTRVYGPRGPLTDLHLLSRGANRAKGIDEIFAHYGFAPNRRLSLQAAPSNLMRAQIGIFSPTWFTVKGLKALSEFDLSDVTPRPDATEATELTNESRAMLPIWLRWLEALAVKEGVIP